MTGADRKPPRVQKAKEKEALSRICTASLAHTAPLDNILPFQSKGCAEPVTYKLRLTAKTERQIYIWGAGGDFLESWLGLLTRQFATLNIP